MFFLAQLFGLIGLIILVISFQQDRKDKLLKYQVFSSLFFSIQYCIIYNIKYFAITGLITTIIEMISAIIAIYRFDFKRRM